MDFMCVRCLYCCTSLLLLNFASCPLPAFCSSLQVPPQQPPLGKHPPERGLPITAGLLVCVLPHTGSLTNMQNGVSVVCCLPRCLACAPPQSRTGRSIPRALYVRALLVLLHLIASELCVLSAACLLFVATGLSATTSSREASPPAWATSGT